MVCLTLSLYSSLPGKATSKECVQLERWDKWVGMFSQDLWTLRTETPSGEFTPWESVIRICMQTRAAMKPRNSCIPGWEGIRKASSDILFAEEFHYLHSELHP